jgi:hypothetical protein
VVLKIRHVCRLLHPVFACIRPSSFINTSQAGAAMQSTLYLLWRVFGTRDDDAVALSIMTLFGRALF